MPTTLVAVSGTSPAIITETVWALAHESPRIIPDEVIVITTSTGETKITGELLTPLPDWKNQSVWQNLRQDLFKISKLPKDSAKLQLDVRVINLPDETTGQRQKAADIRSNDDNDEAANYIIQTLAPLVDAQDQNVIASISGGRKTMGALLYAAMSLLGKESDRVTHVLVNEPFDAIRGFFYPKQPVQQLAIPDYLQSKLTTLKANSAKLELANIPFVPLRNKFSELNERRSFAGLVETYSKAPRAQAPPPHLSLDQENGILTVNDTPIKLTGRLLLIATFLYEHARAGHQPFPNKDDADKNQELTDFNILWKKRHPSHPATMRLSAGGVTVDDIPKALNLLREELDKNGLYTAIPFLAPLRDRIGFEMTDT